MGVVKRIDPPQRERNNAVSMMIDGIEMIIVVAWKKELITVPIPVRNIMVRPDDERHKAEEDCGIHHGPVTPEGLAGVVGDNFRHDPHRRQDSGRTLPGGQGTRTGAARGAGSPPVYASGWPLTTSPLGMKKLVPASLSMSCRTPPPPGAGTPEGEERSDELRPDEERETHEGEPLRPELEYRR